MLSSIQSASLLVYNQGATEQRTVMMTMSQVQSIAPLLQVIND